MDSVAFANAINGLSSLHQSVAQQFTTLMNASLVYPVHSTQDVITAMASYDGYYFDAMTYSNMSTASGPLTGNVYTTGITTAKDDSTNSHNLTMSIASGGSLPTFYDNSKAGIVFGSSVARANVGGGTTGITLIIAMNIPSGGYSPTFWSDSSAAGNGYTLNYNEQYASISFTAGSDVVYAPYTKGSGTIVLAAWHDGSTLNIQICQNTAISNVCGTIAAGSSQASLGANNDAAIDGGGATQFYEVLYIKNAALPASTISGIISYFSTLAGAPTTLYPNAPSVAIIQPPALPSQTVVSWPTANNNSPSPGHSSLVGSYMISDNIWGPPAVYSQTVSAVQETVGTVSMEIDWNFTSTTGSVKTYPNIQIGQQQAQQTTTDARFPKLLHNITTLTTQGISFTTLLGTSTPWNAQFDAGYDIFFSANTPAPAAGSYGGELMIWQQYNVNGLIPGNEPQFTYNIPGGGTALYYVQKLSIGWPYVAFIAAEQTNNVGLDLMQFINYAFAQGYYSGASPALPYPFTTSGPYIDMIEVGIEVSYGQGKTVIQNYAVSMT